MLYKRPVFLSSLIGRRSADSVATSYLHQFHPLSLFSTSSEQVGSGKSFLLRRAIPIVLLSLTGGFALSAVNDIAIFHGCSKKAIERASENQKIVEALGTPIVRGPWYDASLAVGHRRNWVSCTFPVSGPQGSGTFQLKAFRLGEDKWFSFLQHHDWDLVSMEALVDVPSDNENERVLRVSLTDNITPSNTLIDCKACMSPETRAAEN
ncbi:uncharacterized protein LOC110111135 isoform X1 [Dendrobium catenatum]|uniref:Uncharacterized protein n=1 Tax=Dendrobium catenatum TaxID=906689 RepID=A0A2I0VTJ0_9ASPA|nr:uncharacterized protein LOC110111135 isoform X1 [Dendrobium catenatum]PKU66725.1 hypothetical protein MA16_Dca014144 [Dendrobium catenatum]